MTRATVQLEPQDLAALKRATGKADAGQAIATLVNRLSKADGKDTAKKVAKPAKKAAAKKVAKPAKKVAPKAKKATAKAAPKGKAKLTKAEFLARMAKGRAAAAKRRKK